jgi:hypothetical protein
MGQEIEMGLLSNNLVNPQDALVITFDTEGSAESLHIDQFDLGFLGSKKITRATDILFDEASQTWTIYLLTEGKDPALPWKGCKGLPTYEVARSVEVAWLNLCRANDADPKSDTGHVYLNQARKVNGLAI